MSWYIDSSGDIGQSQTCIVIEDDMIRRSVSLHICIRIYYVSWYIVKIWCQLFKASPIDLWRVKSIWAKLLAGTSAIYAGLIAVLDAIKAGWRLIEEKKSRNDCYNQKSNDYNRYIYEFSAPWPRWHVGIISQKKYANNAILESKQKKKAEVICFFL